MLTYPYKHRAAMYYSFFKSSEVLSSDFAANNVHCAQTCHTQLERVLEAVQQLGIFAMYKQFIV